MKYIVLLFLFLHLSASQDYSVRVAHGKAVASDFGEILGGHIKSHEHNLQVYALDVGYLLYKDLFDFPIDLYIQGGFAYFDENGLRKDVYEGTLYFKAFYNLDFYSQRLRIGLGEGGSYTSSVLYAEYAEAIENNDNTANYLNYLDFSIDFDLGRAIGYKKLEDTTLGFLIKHRSSIFGLINNVEKGGTNYNCFYLEKKF
ncbi:MAG: hypothetical protein RBR54_03980 [Sulfurimonas sp.]|nr:hypothetical protein [Sulfurimonas sp.]